VSVSSVATASPAGQVEHVVPRHASGATDALVRDGPSPLGTAVARGVLGAVAATLIALNTSFDATEIAISAVGLVWLTATAGLVLLHGWNTTQSRATAVVDLALLVTAAALTGGSSSPAIAALWLAPVAWAGIADSTTARAMIGVAGVAYVGLWLPDALGDEHGALTELATFAALYLGNTTIALVALHLRGQTADRVTMLARARAALVREVGQVEHDERERLSLRLHDGPLQMVISARQDIEEYRDGDEDALDMGIETLDQGIAALRAVMGDLYPDQDTGTTVREQLAALARRHQARGTFVVELTVDDALASTTDEILVGMTGELIANVAKHARASVVQVSARVVGESAVVEVRDDGVGMTPADRLEAETNGHLGLRSLDRRVRAIGGQWRIRSAPGRGTVVRVELPR
jgi:two-component system NarL family sensor kinase